MKKIIKHIKLDELEKQSPFIVPEGYFDKLPHRIQEKIISKRTIWEQLQNMPTFVKWVPASLAIMLAVFIFWNAPTSETSSIDELLAEVTDDEILEYLLLEDFSTNELVSTLNEYDSISIEINPTESWLNELSNDDLEKIYENYDYDTSLQYY